MLLSPVINIEGLSVNLGNRRVLTNVYLQIEAGYSYAVIGPNGAGKSTLFKSILGLITPDVGKIEIFGEEIEKVRKRIAYVPQKDEIDWAFPASVKDIVLMGRYPFKSFFQRLDKLDYEKANHAMELLGIADLAQRQIGQLSGGQQQRVFIARSICQDADLYFFDEPFVGVDATTEEKIVTIMRNLTESGKTLLVVHHDLGNVREYFNKVVMINQMIIASGDIESVYTEDNIRKCYSAQLAVLQKSRNKRN